jgi:hypothetical protein
VIVCGPALRLAFWAVLAVGALWPAHAIAAACQGQIGPETSLRGKTDYDPFSAIGLAEDHGVSIRNTGAAPCAFGLVLRSRALSPKLGGVLAYELTSPGAVGSLLADGSAATAPIARLRAPLAPAETATIALQLAIPRGQPAAPGLFRDSLEAELYALDAAGRVTGAALDRATLSIAYSAPAVLSVNIKGGDLAATLNFGALVKGQQRSIEIQARSNQPYRLDIASDHGGALVLTPAIPGESWSVPYTAAFAGQRFDLTRPARLANLPPTLPQADASFPLTVTIGEVGQKRAGRYEDVITIAIEGAVP